MPPILISLTSFGAAETRRHGQLWFTTLAHAAGVQGVEVREELLVNPDAEIPLIAAAVRDAGMAAVMKDPRSAALGEMPFDGKRMIFGGFQMVVDA